VSAPESTKEVSWAPKGLFGPEESDFSVSDFVDGPEAAAAPEAEPEKKEDGADLQKKEISFYSPPTVSTSQANYVGYNDHSKKKDLNPNMLYPGLNHAEDKVADTGKSATDFSPAVPETSKSIDIKLKQSISESIQIAQAARAKTDELEAATLETEAQVAVLKSKKVLQDREDEVLKSVGSNIIPTVGLGSTEKDLTPGVSIHGTEKITVTQSSPLEDVESWDVMHHNKLTEAKKRVTEDNQRVVEDQIRLAYDRLRMREDDLEETPLACTGQRYLDGLCGDESESEAHAAVSVADTSKAEAKQDRAQARQDR